MYQNPDSKFLAVLLAATLATAAHAAPVVLPDACGKEEVNFDVKTQKNPPAPAPPEDGKAQIVVISNLVGDGHDVRFGMDGAWVGATKGSSYFMLTVTPGEHHFCASIQSKFKKTVNQYVGMTVVTAEAGKTYYLGYKLTVGGSAGTVVQGHNSPSAPVGTPPPAPTYVAGTSSVSSSFGLLTDDEGKYRVKASPLSTSTPKK